MPQFTTINAKPINRHLVYIIFITLICTLVSNTLWAANIKKLERRASWGAKFTSVFDPLSQRLIGKKLREITENSSIEHAGLVVGDQIIGVNSQPLDSQESWNDLTDALTENRHYQLTIKRNEKTFTVKVQFPPLPLESYENLITEYEQFYNDYGVSQRIIITRPLNQPNKLPAVFMLQGLSCSSVEILPNRSSNVARVTKDIITQSNVVVMRVEKPGLGDSEGNCSSTDFYTELRGYEQALQLLLAKPYIDNTNVIVYGNSMGSALAPYFANKFNLKGVISDGTFFRSWFEHMLEIERRIKQMQGKNETEISSLMNKVYIPLYYKMLVEKQSYQEIITANPHFSAHNYHGDNHMYGRPLRYYQQLQDFDFSGEWQNLTAPVRIRWGAHDWIMSEYDNDMILSTLIQKNHQDIQLYKHPRLDHWHTLHSSPAASFLGEKGEWNDEISGVLLRWIKELTNKNR